MPNFSPEQKNFNKLFTIKGGKFKLSALAPFVGNMTKVKIPSKIKLRTFTDKNNKSPFFKLYVLKRMINVHMNFMDP